MTGAEEAEEAEEAEGAEGTGFDMGFDMVVEKGLVQHDSLNLVAEDSGIPTEAAALGGAIVRTWWTQGGQHFDKSLCHCGLRGPKTQLTNQLTGARAERPSSQPP